MSDTRASDTEGHSADVVDYLTATIVSVARRFNSPSGNPRYNVTLLTMHGRSHTLSTKPNSACGYVVEQARDQGGYLRFTLNEKRHITRITNTDGSSL